MISLNAVAFAALLLAALLAGGSTVLLVIGPTRDVAEREPVVLISGELGGDEEPEPVAQLRDVRHNLERYGRAELEASPYRSLVFEVLSESPENGPE